MEETVVVKKPATPKKRIGVVVAGALNVRCAPSYDAAILTVIKKDSKVVILPKKDKDFYFVRIDNLEGYVAKDFVEEVE